MKNSDILNLYKALVQISEDHDQKFSVKASYAFAKNKVKLKNDAMLIHEERQKILREYGTVQENGDIIIEKEKINEVNEKINELMEIETKVDIDKVSLDLLENNKLSIEIMEALMPILIEPLCTSDSIID